MPKRSTTRSALRRKMVLPVAVLRKHGQEKQLAHTLDLTEDSARLGGLNTTVLEPGEIIEIQRGAVRTKFQVFWMGEPGSAMQGQAGVRAVAPGKNIWGIAMPQDENDLSSYQSSQGRSSTPARSQVKSNARNWHTRFECTGTASLRSTDSDHLCFGQVKDISLSGVYVETPKPLPVNTFLRVKMNVEGVAMETPGVVRTNDPQVGNGISFQEMPPGYQDKLSQVIQTLRRRIANSKKRDDAEIAQPFAQELQPTLVPPPVIHDATQL